jgi:transposase
MRYTHISGIIKEVYAFKGYRIARIFLTENELRILLEKTRKTGLCPSCGKRCRKIESSYERTIRDLDFVDRTTYVVLKEFKISCSCRYRGIEKLDFLDRYSFYTLRLEEDVFRLCEQMCLKHVAQRTKLNWKTVKAIDKKYLRKEVVPLKESSPINIGVDEIAYQKGHQYLTVVRDVDAKKVIWIGEARKKETLDRFFSELGPEKSRRIEKAVMDMWDPYIASVRENCPNTAIIFDKFHISKKVNEALDSIRRKEFAKAPEEERKGMKKKRFLILSRQERLNPEQKESLEDLKRVNDQLYSAYLLKEQVLNIFDEDNPASAWVRLGKWIANVQRSGIKAYENVVKTMKNYWYGIVNYFRYKLTNAASEGFNNKINIIKRRAYGYRDLEYFRLKILHSCGWRSS